MPGAVKHARGSCGVQEFRAYQIVVVAGAWLGAPMPGLPLAPVVSVRRAKGKLLG